MIFDIFTVIVHFKAKKVNIFIVKSLYRAIFRCFEVLNVNKNYAIITPVKGVVSISDEKISKKIGGVPLFRLSAERKSLIGKNEKNMVL